MPSYPLPFPSILDNDFYKFTMQCAVIQKFPEVKAQYAFINRGQHVFPEGFGDSLRQLVEKMSTLALTKEEKKYFGEACPYLSAAYLDYLEGYRYDPSEVHIHQKSLTRHLKLLLYMIFKKIGSRH